MSTDVLATEHWWIVAPFFWALWLGVIALVLFLVLRGRRACRPARTSARDILAERFARGELSSDEYHESLKALR